MEASVIRAEAKAAAARAKHLPLPHVAVADEWDRFQREHGWETWTDLEHDEIFDIWINTIKPEFLGATNGR